jgi:hypothetical protein
MNNKEYYIIVKAILDLTSAETRDELIEKGNVTLGELYLHRCLHNGDGLLPEDFMLVPPDAKLQKKYKMKFETMSDEQKLVARDIMSETDKDREIELAIIDANALIGKCIHDTKRKHKIKLNENNAEEFSILFDTGTDRVVVYLGSNSFGYVFDRKSFFKEKDSDNTPDLLRVRFENFMVKFISDKKRPKKYEDQFKTTKTLKERVDLLNSEYERKYKSWIEANKDKIIEPTEEQIKTRMSRVHPRILGWEKGIYSFENDRQKVDRIIEKYERFLFTKYALIRELAQKDTL